MHGNIKSFRFFLNICIMLIVIILLFLLPTSFVQVDFTIQRDISGPLYVYYEVEHFYQNHRRYFGSKSIAQLQGAVSKVCCYDTLYSTLLYSTLLL